MKTLRGPASSGHWLTVTFVMMLSVGTAVYGEDWPQYRGPNCTGLSQSKKPLPVSFSATDNIRWSVELGEGVCSPTIVAGKVFSTAIQGEETEERRYAVFCFDASDGRKIWERSMPMGTKPLA